MHQPQSASVLKKSKTGKIGKKKTRISSNDSRNSITQNQLQTTSNLILSTAQLQQQKSA
jgi:hypothetical protein